MRRISALACGVTTVLIVVCDLMRTSRPTGPAVASPRPAARSGQTHSNMPPVGWITWRSRTVTPTSPLAGIGKMRARSMPSPAYSSRPGSRRCRTIAS